MSDIPKMRKTSIDLTEGQYFFLKEKALELEKKTGKSCSIISIIRYLIEQDQKKWRRK